MAVLTWSCTPKPQQSESNHFRLGSNFKIKMFQTMKLVGSDLKLTFTGLPEDSRCPEGTTCIWGGQIRAFVEAAVTGEKRSIEFKVEKHKMGKVSKRFQGYEIKVMNVLPYPKAEEKTPKGDYVMELLVTKV